MREPTERHAPSLAQSSLSCKPCNGRISTLSRRLITTLGLATSLACLPAAVVQAQGLNVDVEPAMMSPLSSRTLLLDVAKVGERLVAVGTRGHIVLSDDNGKTWTQSPSPVRQILTSVYFVDEKHGWAVGHDSLILHSNNGGQSWVIQYRDPTLDDPEEVEELLERPLMDVWFRDASTGFAVGAYGLMLRTDDGGETWDDVSFDVDNPDGFHYSALAAIPRAGLFLVGEMGTMYRSADFGDSWETIEDLPYDGSLFGVTGTSRAGEVFAWGLRGNMFRSTDFGDSWEQVELNTPGNGPLEATLSGGHYSPDGRLVVVGLGGAVAVSNDAGRSFEVVVRSDRQALANAKPLADGSLLLLGQRGAQRADAQGLPAAN